MRRLFLVFCAMAMGLAGIVAPVSAEVLTFGNGSRLIKLSKAKLQPRQREEFVEFRDFPGYFGAFAFNTREDKGTFVRNYHSLETAKQAAMMGCKFNDKNKNGDCALYALILPKGMKSNTQQAVGLGQRGLKAFNKVYLPKQKKGTFNAFAISGMSNWSWATDYSSRSKAKSVALKACKKGVSESLATFVSGARRAIRKRGWHKCRLIDASQTR